jgi:hypothetical protein
LPRYLAPDASHEQAAAWFANMLSKERVRRPHA